MRQPRAILITGASGGIGGALAKYYAASGVTLSLFGRDAARLEAVAADCRARGAAVKVFPADVTDRAAMAGLIDAADDECPLELVIANAGVSGGGGKDGAGILGEKPDQARHIIRVNIDGVLNTIEPALAHMTARGHGQVAVMSSLASFAGWAGAPAYSASKGMVRLYGEALRGALAGRGIAVSTICPGFIRTPMTEKNPFPMPFMMTAETAARIIAQGLARNRARIAFPWPTYLAAWCGGLLPAGLLASVTRRLPAKPST